MAESERPAVFFACPKGAVLSYKYKAKRSGLFRFAVVKRHRIAELASGVVVRVVALLGSVKGGWLRLQQRGSGGCT